MAVSSTVALTGFQTTLRMAKPSKLNRPHLRKPSVPTCTIRTTRPSPTGDRTSTPEAFEMIGAATRNKGWINAMGMEDQRLLSKLDALALLAADRTEMHAILAEQRDNWNRLFHSTITMASVSAAAAAAINGAEQAFGLSMVAAMLGLGVTALMALVNKFQPSQLAEEQRHAARFFKRLRADIEATVDVHPNLRDEASHYWEEKVGTLHALDNAFPLPLTPVVLERFPKIVHPSILSPPITESEVSTVSFAHTSSVNGWTAAAVKDLMRTAQILRTSDIPAYVSVGEKVNHINKALAITSPVLAAAGALCSMADALCGVQISSVGAALTVGALFAHNLSHAVQLGAVFETYRNCAGYYADVERTIQKTLRLPTEQREDGAVFLEKVALLLGRTPAETPMVPLADKTAGTLF